MAFRIGYRTIKTAVGTAASILIAQQLGLHNYASAGILTILCIQVTKRRSLRTSWDRFLACVLAMPFSALFFEGIAYHPIVIGVMLFFFIPLLVMLKARDGIVTSSVIILHIYMAQKISMANFLNELGVIIIGIGVALLINLYMPSADRKLRDYQHKLEENFKIILCELVRYLRTGDSDWGGKEITECAQLLEEAKALAFRDVENHLLRDENLYFHYFKMREKQFEILERVLPIVTSITRTVRQGKMVADFLEDLSENVHPGNTAHIYIDKLREMKKEFEEMELPKTREEFETRAALLQLVKEMNNYLIIKSSFKGMKTFMNERKKVEAK
ncbi:aromatic acid exporter family protein [Paenibacillus sp. BSR1-1]|uniref:aromatic acid exporter family protein n=1 Tax=Paenibacillus sp. BSR1-1 TaxID=3020845 RepID=UPI0025B26434|nr:aromatic acid exporter family protein [Paenibacillus sp. BSR1-1]MDN3016598.1 aromatic acid exporter family protein [Paenibacillus sp. BSR1-1]